MSLLIMLGNKKDMINTPSLEDIFESRYSETDTLMLVGATKRSIKRVKTKLLNDYGIELSYPDVNFEYNVIVLRDSQIMLNNYQGDIDFIEINPVAMRYSYMENVNLTEFKKDDIYYSTLRDNQNKNYLLPFFSDKEFTVKHTSSGAVESMLDYVPKKPSSNNIIDMQEFYRFYLSEVDILYNFVSNTFEDIPHFSPTRKGILDEPHKNYSIFNLDKIGGPRDFIFMPRLDPQLWLIDAANAIYWKIKTFPEISIALLYGTACGATIAISNWLYNINPFLAHTTALTLTGLLVRDFYKQVINKNSITKTL